MRQYLDSDALQRRVAAFFASGDPSAAICHGVLVLARSIDPATGRASVRAPHDLPGEIPGTHRPSGSPRGSSVATTEPIRRTSRTRVKAALCDPARQFEPRADLDESARDTASDAVPRSWSSMATTSPHAGPATPTASPRAFERLLAVAAR